MKELQKFKLNLWFEKHNTKYNRLWEQLTNIGIFILATFSGYIIAIGSTERGMATLFAIEINRILLGMAVILAIVCSVLVTHLVSAKTELKNIMKTIEIQKSVE